MRTFRRAILALMLGAIPVAAPGFAFDGAPAASQDSTIPVVSAQPGAAAAINFREPKAEVEALVDRAAEETERLVERLGSGA